MKHQWFRALKTPVLGAASIALALLFSASHAHATYRADFFDTSKRPTVTFDKGKTTWTLRNQGVERIVRYDAKAGALETVALRDLKTHHALKQAPGGEGEISFAAPLLETPQTLVGWKTADAEPGSAWTQPTYDDSKWRAVSLPPVGERANSQPGSAPHWYRAAIPAGQLKTGHAYALYLPSGAIPASEIYADGVSVANFANVTHPSRKAEQVDLPPHARQIAVRVNGGTSPLPTYIAEVGTSPPNLTLTGNWQYMQHTINVGENNSEVLSIRLSGLKQYEGFELDVSYQIYAGEEPTIAKWFSFVHHRKSNFLLESATLDKWILPEGRAGRQRVSGQTGVFTDAFDGTEDVLLTAALEVGNVVEVSGNSAAPTAYLDAALKPELPQRTPRSLTAFWHGNSRVPAFLYQLYLGQYVARGTPDSLPIAYNTRFTYRDQIDAATCEKIIPIAAALGLQAFVLDDGWQTNRAADTGRYGDWLTDKNKFPQGLLPVSTLVRVNKMRFGLWTDATAVSPGSQAALLHPEWLYKSLPDEPEDQPPMCFTGAWARQYAQSFLSLCREQSITYLKVKFHSEANCMATEHEHPTGHSLGAQSEAWAMFNDILHGVDKSLVLLNVEGGMRQTTGSAPDVNDGWLDKEWLEPYQIGNRKQEIGFWYTLSDVLQPKDRESEAADALFLQPSFTLCGQALCHVPMPEAITRDQLDYLWSSVTGRYANYEVQGDLQQMTAEEREIAHKWLDWSRQNREWLAYTQPLVVENAANGSKHGSVTGGNVRGILHLRNLLQGRYGYVCLWNMDNAEATVMPSFDPSDYFVRVKSGMNIVNTKDSKPVPYSTHGGTISLGKITLPSHGWAIYEIKGK